MVNRRTVLATGLAALGALPAMPWARAETLANAARVLLEEGRYLPLLRQMQAEAPNNPAMRDPLAQVLAMTGDETAAVAPIPTHDLAAPDLSQCVALDALEVIVAAAKTRQIVILNEAHNVSRSRAFAEALMTRLYTEGFTVFAAETFTNTERLSPSQAMRDLNGGAPLTAALGWYLADPVFAEMVRAARRLGYRFAAYEARPDQMQSAGPSAGQQIEVREDAEANNFIAHILDDDPKARVFVYCGYDHVLKSQVYGNQLWFAGRLKAKTGIDPLCIGQAWTVPPPVGLPEDVTLAAILDQFRPKLPIILRDAAGEAVRLSVAKPALDFEVLHPRLSEVDGRPGWLAAAPGRQAAHYKLDEMPPPNALLQAVPQDETVSAAVVPADQYPAPLNAREAVFYLKPGSYEVRVEDEYDRRTIGKLAV
ncbi:MAG: hypothetical protein P4L57_00660 [Rhizomicrobium sp.]|nr:hypothetical protein [Rhizomicrobium sp.]